MSFERAADSTRFATAERLFRTAEGRRVFKRAEAVLVLSRPRFSGGVPGIDTAGSSAVTCRTRPGASDEAVVSAVSTSSTLAAPSFSESREDRRRTLETGLLGGGPRGSLS